MRRAHEHALAPPSDDSDLAAKKSLEIGGAVGADRTYACGIAGATDPPWPCGGDQTARWRSN
eukprot:scaffold250367_cov31-Tisochrysis_lutea.AAC.4